MTSIRWDPNLETGESSIDEQHRQMFALVNELDGVGQGCGPDPTVESVLETLSEYLVVHFEAERQLMLSTAYDPAETTRHLRQHDEFTRAAREFVLAYHAGELDSIGPLVTFLDEWLREHICRTDMRMVEHVRGQQRAPRDGRGPAPSG